MSTLVKDDFFLSASNPLANVDQRDLEALAIRVFETREIQQAKERAKARWKAFIGKRAPEEAWSRFDQLLGDEWAFQKIIKAVNSDPNYPKVMGNLWSAPHAWFGMRVPGSRAADNPDNSYSFIPIGGYAHYELIGRKLSEQIDAPFQLVANSPMTTTLGILAWEDVRFESDGTFRITLDPEPAKGRLNHIQTTIDSKYLLMRHSRSDWYAMPNAYRVRRLDPPAAPPMTFEQVRNRAAIMMMEDIPANYWWMHHFNSREPNVCSQAFTTSDIGGIATQRIMQARMDLADDEAFVITIRHGGASYRGMLLFNPFARTTDYWACTSSLNNTQSIPSPDDTTTFVVSIQDPGVHNWIDMSGMHHAFLLHRWQGLPSAGIGSDGWALGKVVKLDHLGARLPSTMRYVTPTERKQQLAERLSSFLVRFLDH